MIALIRCGDTSSARVTPSCCPRQAKVWPDGVEQRDRAALAVVEQRRRGRGCGSRSRRAGGQRERGDDRHAHADPPEQAEHRADDAPEPSSIRPGRGPPLLLACSGHAPRSARGFAGMLRGFPPEGQPSAQALAGMARNVFCPFERHRVTARHAFADCCAIFSASKTPARQGFRMYFKPVASWPRRWHGTRASSVCDAAPRRLERAEAPDEADHRRDQAVQAGGGPRGADRASACRG